MGGFDRYEGMNVRIEPVSMLFSLLSSVILGDRLGDRGFVSFFFLWSNFERMIRVK